MKKSNWIILLLPLFFFSCEWEGSYRSKSFLHYSGPLTDCRDIHGADLMSLLNFREYPGEDYTSYFDKHACSIKLGVELTENKTCKGTGHIKVVAAQSDMVYLEESFEYYAVPTELSAARIISTLGDKKIVGDNEFVYFNATWIRITLPISMEDTVKNLSFQFVCTIDTGYPNVFRS